MNGRVVVITGAGSGIGAASARQFAAAGARVVVSDVSDRDGEAVAAAIERFGAMHVPFNNAGIGTYGAVPELAPDAWQPGQAAFTRMFSRAWSIASARVRATRRPSSSTVA
jgi:NAD(P)-dependent dehydrogenase (short-subunit alcohol dehydrogenase family)